MLAVLVSLLFAACVSLIVVMAGLFQPLWALAWGYGGATQAILATEQPWYTGQPFVAALCVAVVYPATLARTLKVLEYTSVGALLSIFFASGVVLDEGGGVYSCHPVFSVWRITNEKIIQGGMEITLLPMAR